MTIVIGAAAIGKLDTLQKWVWKSQAQLLYQSRSSTWGSPNVFRENLHLKIEKQNYGSKKKYPY